jgi:hypothetical protein
MTLLVFLVLHRWISRPQSSGFRYCNHSLFDVHLWKVCVCVLKVTSQHNTQKSQAHSLQFSQKLFLKHNFRHVRNPADSLVKTALSVCLLSVGILI